MQSIQKIFKESMNSGFSRGVRRPLLALLVAILFLGTAPSAFAALGGIDATYNTGGFRPRIAKISTNGVFDGTYPAGTGFNGDVNALARQGDGKMIVGGTFTSFNGTGRNYIARLNADGTLDGTFNPGTGFNGWVTAVVMDGTDIYVAGFFSSFNGTLRSGIARLNSDGSIDAGFNPGTGFNNTTYALVMDGTDVYVGGQFATYNGTARANIARINTDGSLDAGFNPGAGFTKVGGSSALFALALDGTDIYAGGVFDSFNGTARNNIARVNTDGTIDGGFDPGTGFNSTVIALAMDGTDVYVGGDFSSFNGTGRAEIARLNTDGTLDGAFVPGLTGGTVWALAMDGADVVVGGVFTAVDATPRRAIARLNTNGSLDAGFNVGAGVDSSVFALAMDGTDVIIGGRFVTDLNTGFNNTVMATVAQSDGKVIVGGSFTSFNGTSRNRIARLNADGTLDNTFDPGTGFDGTVSGLAIDGTDVYAVGSFSNFDGTGRSRIARLNSDGTLDGGFDPGTGLNGSAFAVVMDGTDVYAGGSFTSFNGTGRNRIVRINTNGTIDAGFDPGTGFDASVNALVMDGTDVYAGGSFTSFNGTGRNRIVRINTNGTIDAGFDPGTGFDASVSALVMHGTDVYAGGAFTTFNAVASSRIARLNTDGTLDAGFSTGVGFNGTSVNALVMDGPYVIVGGNFTNYQTLQHLDVIRLNPTGSIETAFSNDASGFDNTVNALTIAGTNLVAGGAFYSYKGVGAVRLAKIDATDPAGITTAITDGSTSVNESGTTDSFTVELNEKPGSDVVINLTSTDLGEVTVAPASLTFTTANWFVPQTVTVTGVDDVLVDGVQSANITLSVNDAGSSNEYDPLADQNVLVTISDNDNGGGGGGGGGGGLVNTIHLISPNGGEALHAGQQVQVSWQYTGSSNHTAILALSTDGGSTYAQIAAPAQQDSGLYTWTVPDINTSSAKLRVDFVQNGSVVVSDVSDASFSIAGTVVTPPGDGTNPPPAVPTVFTPSATINEDLGILASVTPTPCVSGSLIRTASLSSVYYCGANGKRYVFTNEKVYFSWYADFSGVTVISNETMAAIQLGGNVTYKPGTRMIKIESDPKVYVVSRGGLLRWVPTEVIATRLYGTTWNKMIDDVSVSFFPNYRLGTEIQAAEIP